MSLGHKTHVKNNRFRKMSLQSSPSDSDSEISDTEEMVENVAKAFQAMRKHLKDAGFQKAGNNKSSDGSFQSISSKSVLSVKKLKPRAIYQTFSRNEHSKQKTENSNTVTDKPIETNQENFANFFIDKGPSVSNSNVDEECIVAYDLSNIGDTVSDNDNNQNTESIELFDLTNNDGSNKLRHKLEDQDEDGSHIKNKNDSENESEEEENPEFDDEDELVKKKSKKKKKNFNCLSSQLQSGLAMNDIYINVNPLGKKKAGHSNKQQLQKHKEPEVMKKSVISDDFERQDSIATTHVSMRQMKKQRKLEREKTKGSKWFNMPATELTEERKHDLAVLQMRKVLDPKRFYKANDMKTAPKYFQFGTVIEDAADFYSSRIPKKQRKSTIVEELLADAEFRKFNKRKYEEVQEAKRHGKGPYKHMKRLKKRNK